MGKRGPQKTPTAILKLRGSRWVKDREGEPAPELGRPDCPQWLDATAKWEWKRILPHLETMGVLAKSDRAMVAGYCQQYSTWVAAVKELRKESLKIGTTEYSRIATVSNNAYTAMVRTAAKLGLSPADRAGLTPKSSDLSDPLDKLIRRGRKPKIHAG